MKHLKKHLEQLEEAGKFIDQGTPTYARLALMMLDNLVEMLMYNRIRHELAFDDRLLRVGPTKYAPKKREKIMEKFPPKVEFLVTELKLLTPDEGEILKVAHQFRNEAYHRGVVRDSIIGTVTRVHMAMVCDLIPRAWTGVYGYSAMDDIPDLFNRYGVEASHIDEESLRSVCDSILGDRTCSTKDLSQSLSQDLQQRVQDIHEGIEILVHDGYTGSPFEDILKEIQFYQYFLDQYQLEESSDENCGFVNYHRDREEWKNRFNPPVTLQTIERWMLNARKITSCVKVGASLRKYINQDRDMHPLESLLDDAIFHFDMEIDMKIKAGH